MFVILQVFSWGLVYCVFSKIFLNSLKLVSAVIFVEVFYTGNIVV